MVDGSRCHDKLGGGFNPFEKYARQIESLLQVWGESKTHLKPPPSKSGRIFEVPWNLNWSLERTGCPFFGLNQLISEECWKEENDSTSWLQTKPTLPKTLVIGMPGGHIILYESEKSTVLWFQTGMFGKTLRLLFRGENWKHVHQSIDLQNSSRSWKSKVRGRDSYLYTFLYIHKYVYACIIMCIQIYIYTYTCSCMYRCI